MEGGPLREYVSADLKTLLNPRADAGAAGQAQARLLRHGPRVAEAVVSALLRSLESSPRDVRYRMRLIGALGKFGRESESAVNAAMPVLIALAGPGGQRVSAAERVSALIALADVGRGGDRVVPVFAEALRERDPPDDARKVALYYGLPRYARVAGTAVPALRDLIKDPDASVRDQAMSLLGEIGPVAKAAVPDLLAVLRDRSAHPRDRGEAAAALGGVSHSDTDMVPVLIRASTDPAPGVRLGAVRGLGNLGVATPDVVATLTAALSSGGDPDLRRQAVFALGRLGPGAAKALPAVEDAGRRDPALATAVAITLLRLGREREGRDRLTALAVAPEAERHFFIDTLGEDFRPLAVPVLAEVVRRNARGGYWAMEALQSLGPDAAAAVPALVAFLKVGRPRGADAPPFEAAIATLGRIGPAATEALPLLRELAENGANAGVRRDAAAAIERITQADDTVVPPQRR